MKTELLQADKIDAIQRAGEILRGGGLVAFPTETVYGLGANALDADAVARIYVAKGRPSRNPIIVHVADAEAAVALVAEWPETASLLATHFWPGPLTLVLPRTPQIPDVVTGGGPTVGVRVPAHPVARALLLEAGIPIAAPSANLSLQLSPTRAEHVLAGLDGRIDALLDGGPTYGGLESTVLDLTPSRPTLLRPGLITPAEIEAIVGPIDRLTSHHSLSVADTAPLPAPGMLSRHYAPRAPLEIYREIASGDTLNHLERLLKTGERVGWLTQRDRSQWEALTLSGGNSASEQAGLHVAPMPATPSAYASDLYTTLHALDALGVTRIVVDPLPETDAWLAIRDRLQRAAVNG